MADMIKVFFHKTNITLFPKGTNIKISSPVSWKLKKYNQSYKDSGFLSIMTPAVTFFNYYFISSELLMPSTILPIISLTFS